MIVDKVRPMKRTNLGLVAIACLMPMVSNAEGDLSRVVRGASTKEIVTLLGAPAESIERETKREVVWYYPAGSVVFSHGTVKSVYIAGSSDDRLSAEYQKSLQDAKPVVASTTSSPVEDILSEILREVPSEAGTDGSGQTAVAPGEVRPLDVGR